MDYNLIIHVLTDVLSINANTEYTEVERIAYTEGALKFLNVYLMRCKKVAEGGQVKIIGGIWDEQR